MTNLMNELAYPATFTPDVEDGGFVITFPDVHEAITQANSIEEGLVEAQDCLDEAICGRLKLKKNAYLSLLNAKKAISY